MLIIGLKYGPVVTKRKSVHIITVYTYWFMKYVKRLYNNLFVNKNENKSS